MTTRWASGSTARIYAGLIFDNEPPGGYYLIARAAPARAESGLLSNTTIAYVLTFATHAEVN